MCQGVSKVFFLKYIHAKFQVCELHQKCVPFYLCNEDNKINDDGSLLIDPRSDAPRDFLMEQCPTLEKCCLKENTNVKPPPEQLCQDSFFNVPEKCGFRNLKGLGGKVNDMQNSNLYTQYGEFPWMMAVLMKSPVGSSTKSLYQAGGSLIHPKIVMTAAHKVDEIDPRKLVVRGGEWDTQSEREMCEHVERKVESVISHERFLRRNFQNDIALLVLEDEFLLTPFINTICLPPNGMHFDNRRCLSSGWGKDKFGKAGIHQVFLKKVELPVVPHTDCQNKFRKTRLGVGFKLHDGFLCAGKNFFFESLYKIFILFLYRWRGRKRFVYW